MKRKSIGLLLALLLLGAVRALQAGDEPATPATNRATGTGGSSNGLWRMWLDLPTNAAGSSVSGAAGAGATNRWARPGTDGIMATSSPWRVTAEVEVGMFRLRDRACGRHDVTGWYQGVDVGVEREVVPGEFSVGLGLGVGRYTTRFP